MIECLLCSIANVYYLQANYPEALKMHEDVLAIRVAKLGLEHPDIATTYCNMGNVYRSMGEYKKGLEYHNKDLAITIKVHGPEHPFAADTKHKCARLCSPLDSTFNSTNAVFWLGHFCSIALVLKQQAKYNEAIKLCCENLAVYEKCYGPDHAGVIGTKNLIADLQELQGASMDLPAGAHVRISGLSAGRS